MLFTITAATKETKQSELLMATQSLAMFTSKQNKAGHHFPVCNVIISKQASMYISQSVSQSVSQSDSQPVSK